METTRTADQTGYRCEECDEYLLIEEASSDHLHQQGQVFAQQSTPTASQKTAAEKGNLVKIKSTDSGYDGRVSPTSSPSQPSNSTEEVECDIMSNACSSRVFVFSYRIVKRSGASLMKI